MTDTQAHARARLSVLTDPAARQMYSLGLLMQDVATVLGALAAVETERDRLRAAIDDDAMTAIVQGALADLGDRTRLDTGESLREYCNSVAGEIIGALRRQYAAALGGEAG